MELAWALLCQIPTDSEGWHSSCVSDWICKGGTISVVWVNSTHACRDEYTGTWGSTAYFSWNTGLAFQNAILNSPILCKVGWAYGWVQMGEVCVNCVSLGFIRSGMIKLNLCVCSIWNTFEHRRALVSYQSMRAVALERWICLVQMVCFSDQIFHM